VFSAVQDRAVRPPVVGRFCPGALLSAFIQHSSVGGRVAPAPAVRYFRLASSARPSARSAYPYIHSHPRPPTLFGTRPTVDDSTAPVQCDVFAPTHICLPPKLPSARPRTYAKP